MKKVDEHVTREKIGSSNLLEAFFSSLPDAVIIWSREGRMLQMNSAARKLFEVSAERQWRGSSHQDFFLRHQMCDEQQQCVYFAPCLLVASLEETAAPRSYEQAVTLSVLSGEQVSLILHCSPILDGQKHVLGVASIFSRITPHYQKALHLERVHEAVSTLNRAISEIPERFDFTISESKHLLSAPVFFVAQQLVDLIRHVLNCWRVSLLTINYPAENISYAVGSGFTREQEERRRSIKGGYPSSKIVDETVLARLYAHQEVILSSDRLHFPKGHPADDIKAAVILFVPLFLDRQLIGTLAIFKEGWDRGYTRDEIDLVKAVAEQATLVIECLSYLQVQDKVQSRDLVLCEVNRLSREFLTLASHELRTPLTGIKGNLQLAQRRLDMLKRHLAEQPERVHEHIQQAQQSLIYATESARQQERMIQDMIDDARIQAGQLTLFPKNSDLLVLIKAAITLQQKSVPARPIILEVLTTGQVVPVFVDTQRIIQVLTIYLAHALDYSPAERPVTVQLKVEEQIAHVLVHDDGPGISREEQARLWDRFYRGKGNTVQHELDLSLGLSFYLCQALIARQGGSVGVQSEPGHGATFWFTLPSPPLDSPGDGPEART